MSYHFVAAAGEAAEAPDRHLKAATLGHDVGPVRKLLKEQKTRALWREDGVERGGVNIGRWFDDCPPDSSGAALYKCLTVTWHVTHWSPPLPPWVTHSESVPSSSTGTVDETFLSFSAASYCQFESLSS